MSTAKAATPASATTADMRDRLAELERALTEEARRADVLNRIAAAIGSGGDLEGIVQAVVDGGVELCGAELGAFFYNRVDETGESYTLTALSGPARSAFGGLPMPRNTAVFDPTFSGGGVVRSDDITADPLYGKSQPHYGMPKEHPPVRSYLAASVVSRTGEVIGGLFFGHPTPGIFPARLEPLMTGLAAQAAVAIDTVRLHEATLREVEERQRAERELIDREHRYASGEARAHDRLQFALQAGRLGSWEMDVESRWYEASDICKANYGRGGDEPFGFDDLVGAIHPEDRVRMVRAIEDAIRTGDVYDLEYRVIHPNGEVRWVHVRGRVAHTADHGARRMAGVSLDVTDRKRAEERQRLLTNELNHRVKNTLATVQSIASQTLRSARDPSAFRDAFEARLMALSQTHNLLTSRNWEEASLHDILRLELTPHAGGREGGGSRFMLESHRDVRLSSKAAVALGMAIHELATNAVKYGSLSHPAGLVAVRTSVRGAGEAKSLVLEWSESGGPPVVAPARRGFGSRVIQHGLAAELDGEVELDYRPEGLSCRMRLPMRALEPYNEP